MKNAQNITRIAAALIISFGVFQQATACVLGISIIGNNCEEPTPPQQTLPQQSSNKNTETPTILSMNIHNYCRANNYDWSQPRQAKVGPFPVFVKPGPLLAPGPLVPVPSTKDWECYNDKVGKNVGGKMIINDMQAVCDYQYPGQGTVAHHNAFGIHEGEPTLGAGASGWKCIKYPAPEVVFEGDVWEEEAWEDPYGRRQHGSSTDPATGASKQTYGFNVNEVYSSTVTKSIGANITIDATIKEIVGVQASFQASLTSGTTTFREVDFNVTQELGPMQEFWCAPYVKRQRFKLKGYDPRKHSHLTNLADGGVYTTLDEHKALTCKVCDTNVNCPK